MTDFDKKLIVKALGFRSWDFRDVKTLITIADTEEARAKLRYIYYSLRALLCESL